jgi:hypothetical protein
VRSLLAVLVALAACSPGSGGIVAVPLAPAAGKIEPRTAPTAPGFAGSIACTQPWTLEHVAGGGGTVILVCGNDAHRQPLDPASASARAVAAALAPARERVCTCATRMASPQHVDLVVRAFPAEGRATVEASDPEEDLDPTLGPPFLACIGTVVATFAPTQVEECADPAKTSLVYPMRVELAGVEGDDGR